MYLPEGADGFASDEISFVFFWREDFLKSSFNPASSMLQIHKILRVPKQKGNSSKRQEF